MAAKLLDGRSLGQVLMAFVRGDGKAGTNLVAVGCRGSVSGTFSTKIHSPSSVRGLAKRKARPL